MSRHSELLNLVNVLSPKEKSEFLRTEEGLASENLLNLLSNPSLAKAEIAKKLDLSKKSYKNACEKVYGELSRFLLSFKGSLENDIEYKLRESQLMAELLKEKGLITESLQKIEASIETATHFELFNHSIPLRRQYLKIASYRPDPTEHDKVMSFMQQITKEINLQKEYDSLQLIYYQLMTLRYKMAIRITPEEQEEVRQLYDKLREFDPAQFEGSIISIYYYQSCLLTAFMLGWTENIAAWNTKVLTGWQQTNYLIPIHQELFIHSVNLQAYTHFLIKDVVAAKNYLDQYQALATDHLASTFHKNWFDIISFQTNVKLLHKTFQYEKVDGYFSKKWTFINKLLTVLSEAEKLDILISASITFFVLQQWEKAEEIIHEVKSTNQKVKRVDTLYFTFVFHCLILYEQKEWARLDSLINSEYHFLYSNKALRAFEKDMLLFLKKLPVTMFKAKAEENTKAFLKRLDAYRDNNLLRLHFATFDFYSWIESKIEGVPYTTFVKKKAMAQKTMAGKQGDEIA